jgi:hypothetical protein
MLNETVTSSFVDLRAISAAVLAALMLLLAEKPAAAQAEIFPTDIPWTVQPPFGQDNAARTSISGAACTAIEPARKFCLAVFEDAKYAQFFAITGTAIRPDAVINLVPDASNHNRFKNLGAEAAGFDAGFFYVVNSRAARILLPLPGETFDPSFLVSRFAVDPVRGVPAFPLPGNPVPPQVEVSKKLQAAIAAGVPIGGSPPQVLDKSRAEVEGVAVKNGVMYFGFRGPPINGQSLILSATVQSVFGTGPLNSTVHRVALGDAIGIRDMARVADGILILAGPVADQPAAPTLFHWNEQTNQLRNLGVLVQPANRKAEALIVLTENLEFYNILVMYDEVVNGGPTLYGIPL